MGRVERLAKSILAGSLGVLPYMIAKLSLKVVRNCAALLVETDDLLKEFHRGAIEYPAKSSSLAMPWFIFLSMRVTGAVVCSFATLSMITSAKVFALSQYPSWGHYVEAPLEDGPNTRLAWYGASSQSTEDCGRMLSAIWAKSEIRLEQLTDLQL